MIYLKNWIFIISIKILNKYGRLFYLKKRFFSSQAILEKNFPKQKNFNFIQIGANDGVSFDFLYDFIIKRNSEGIVVEPVKEYFDELVQNYKDYPKIIKINMAVHSLQKNVIINRISPNAVKKYPEWVKGIASLDANHHKKTGIDSCDIVEEIVKADILMNIVNQNIVNQNIDFFQVDTEGFDYEIIKMIDFNIIRPNIIKYESVNLNQNDKIKLEYLLIHHKYFLFDEMGDTLAIDLNRVKLYK